eukprot:3713983-Amphidinium_carterae.1
MSQKPLQKQKGLGRLRLSRGLVPVSQGWKVKKYRDASRVGVDKGLNLAGKMGNRHLVYAPSYVHAAAFNEALGQRG